MLAAFRVLRHRFRFEVLSPVYFPPYKAENVLRGMAGLLLPASAGEILNPIWRSAPSGFATPPKPFVFRAHHLDGLRFQPGAGLHFDIHDFAPRLPIRDSFESAMKRLEIEGLGPGRGKLRLLSTETDSFRSAAVETSKIGLNFITPTEIETAFDILIARLHDRINALSTCYQNNPLPPLERVKVRVVRDETRHIERQRFSTRTGQTYETGGVVGMLTYEGSLAAAIPYLEVGQWTGIGDGHYEIAIQ